MSKVHHVKPIVESAVITDQQKTGTPANNQSTLNEKASYLIRASTKGALKDWRRFKSLPAAVKAVRALRELYPKGSRFELVKVIERVEDCGKV